MDSETPTPNPEAQEAKKLYFVAGSCVLIAEKTMSPICPEADDDDAVAMANGVHIHEESFAQFHIEELTDSEFESRPTVLVNYKGKVYE